MQIRTPYSALLQESVDPPPHLEMLQFLNLCLPYSPVTIDRLIRTYEMPSLAGRLSSAWGLTFVNGWQVPLLRPDHGISSAY
jgi:hypothetical protein